MRATVLVAALVMLALGACSDGDDPELKMWVSTVCPALQAMEEVVPLLHPDALLTPAQNRRFVEERVTLYIAAADDAFALLDNTAPPARAVASQAYLRG
jgi:hypothetical protein